MLTVSVSSKAQKLGKNLPLPIPSRNVPYFHSREWFQNCSQEVTAILGGCGGSHICYCCPQHYSSLCPPSPINPALTTCPLWPATPWGAPDPPWKCMHLLCLDKSLWHLAGYLQHWCQGFLESVSTGYGRFNVHMCPPQPGTTLVLTYDIHHLQIPLLTDAKLVPEAQKYKYVFQPRDKR